MIKNIPLRASRVLSIWLVCLLFMGATGSISPAEVFAAKEYKISQNFEYELHGGKAYIVGYTGQSQSITVPEKLAGKTVVSVELCDYEGSAINLSKCKGLKSFYAEQIFLDKLDLRSNRKLTSLTLDESGCIKTLDLSKNTKLKRCYIYTESIKKLNLSGCKALKKLYIFHCPIAKLDLGACKSLTDLAIQNTELRSLSLAKNRSLKRVELADNNLRTVNTGKNKRLKGLKFS